MDKYVIDIDAVLDEFEESENRRQPQPCTPAPQLKKDIISAFVVKSTINSDTEIGVEPWHTKPDISDRFVSVPQFETNVLSDLDNGSSSPPDSTVSCHTPACFPAQNNEAVFVPIVNSRMGRISASVVKPESVPASFPVFDNGSALISSIESNALVIEDVETQMPDVINVTLSTAFFGDKSLQTSAPKNDLEAILTSSKAPDSSTENLRISSISSERSGTLIETSESTSYASPKTQRVPSAYGKERRLPIDRLENSQEIEHSLSVESVSICEEEEGVNESVSNLKDGLETDRDEEGVPQSSLKLSDTSESVPEYETFLESGESSRPDNKSDDVSSVVSDMRNATLTDSVIENKFSEMEPVPIDSKITAAAPSLESSLTESSGGPSIRSNGSSPAVKPKTPSKLKAKQRSSSGVSSEQFEEFLRKKSLENAHLLSAHNSPVLQRYRKNSPSRSAVQDGSDCGQVLDKSEILVNKTELISSVDEAPPLLHQHALETTQESRNVEARSELAHEEPSSHTLLETLDSDLQEQGGKHEFADSTEQVEQDEKSPRTPLKSDTSNYYRIVGFDMSAVDVTDDDLHLLESEIESGEVVPDQAQASEASQTTNEGDTVDNGVNNNTKSSIAEENIDNPFDTSQDKTMSDKNLQSAMNDSSSKTVVTQPVHSQPPQIDDQNNTTTLETDVASDSELGAVGGVCDSERMLATTETSLGKVRPPWIPDEDAPICMNCGQDFTIFRRRHHCRACGKVLCGACCKDRARLPFMDHELARVCSVCIEVLNRVERWASRPDPSNPMDYCSTVSPLAQLSSTAQLPPPTVLVPVGVLKKGGEKSNTSGNGIGGSNGSKSVMFSDGIRPGGDLTDLDIPSTPPAQRAPQRTMKQLATGRSKGR